MVSDKNQCLILYVQQPVVQYAQQGLEPGGECQGGHGVIVVQ